MSHAGDLNTGRQQKRLWWRIAFFSLFVLAPPLDLFRYDLTLGHLILFGQPWTLGIDAFRAGEIGAGEAAMNLVLRGLLPIVLLGGLLIGVAWRWGRLYCGWLCPHFSVVEMINGLMRRTFGRPTLWERQRSPGVNPDRRYWPLTLLAVVGFAFIWALSLLSYLLPPFELYGNLLNGTPTRNQALFLAIATGVFSLEFLFARHLFCRFGCAVGLFQSLAWMANRKAMVVGFNSGKSRECIDCNAACDHACPMRLKPRSIKRRMFTCTQCARCLQACDSAQTSRGREPLLKWLDRECALLVSDHNFGHKPQVDKACFNEDNDSSGQK
ncbi:MAG: 4Fe-4S binding protein [Gammaproteobacteria bacterium]|nr:4Fe-4S binding protein [Gammaproteobacteria bacterium]MCW8972236.1 4Fe-4S binding protein [Gammaproteobacteria bacterium]MCW8993874.1 4Fe-4S binding protein [Gammaproteobacteria bacterium]